MNPFTPAKESYAARRAALAATAMAMAAAVSGIAATDAAAAPAKAHKSNHSHRRARHGHARLEHGLLTVKGTRGRDAIVLGLKPGNPGIVRVDVGHERSEFRRSRIMSIAVDARAGNDRVRIDEAGGVFTDQIPTRIDGGDGNDVLTGGSGAELLRGGNGNDLIDGGRGSDVAQMGSGDDTFVWNPGEGSDTIEGQAGNDTMRFNGANVAEQFDLSANGSRLRFVRDVGNITMDTAGVENVDLATLGGADTVTVNDLTGTDVTRVSTDLAGSGGGGDGQSDHVIVNGTDGNDAVDISGDSNQLQVGGLNPTVTILNAEPANDRLDINTGAGIDTLSSVALVAGSIQLFFDGTLIP